MRLFFFIACFTFVLVGCRTVETALQDYQNCIGNVECASDVARARELSYTITRSAVNTSFPSAGELVGLVVSNAFAFLLGVWKGRKRGD